MSSSDPVPSETSICLGTLRNTSKGLRGYMGGQCAFTREEPLIATLEEGHIEGNLLLSAFRSPSKMWAMRTVVCILEDLSLPRQPVVD